MDPYGRIDEFSDILNELYDEIPDEYFKDLNLGIIIEEEVKIHPEAKNNDLYILGEYQVDILGKKIRIYYGSFMETYGNYDHVSLKHKVRETLLHELLHHRETLSGYKDLVVEDEEFIKNYKNHKF